MESSFKNNELNAVLIINASREKVYNAWTDSSQLAKWWGPRDFTNPVCEIDAREGGEMKIDMTGPDGTVYPMKGTFKELKEPERIVFTSTAVDDGNGNYSLEVLTNVKLEESNGGTKLILKAAVTKALPDAKDAVAGMEEGWKQSLDRLTELAEG